MSEFWFAAKAVSDRNGVPCVFANGLCFFDHAGLRITAGENYKVTVEKMPMAKIIKQEAEYQEFMSRSSEEVTLAIFDKLGVKLTPKVNHDDNDRGWAE